MRKKWFERELEKARARAERKASRSNSQQNDPQNGGEEEGKKTPPSEILSFEDWLRYSQRLTSLQEREKLANAILSDAKSVLNIVEAVSLFNKLGQIQNPQKWDQLPWPQKLETITGLTPELQKIVQLLKENPLLQNILLRLVDDFHTPLQKIKTWRGLEKFLRGIEAKGLVRKIEFPTPSITYRNGILIQQTLFLPIHSSVLSRVGWILVKEAEKQVRENEARFERLKSQTEENLPLPIEISNGKKGRWFLQLSQTQAVLLECKEEAGQPHLSILDAVGIEIDQFPRQSGWDSLNNCPTERSELWKKVHKALCFHSSRERRERKKRVANLKKRHPSLLPIPLKYTSLTKLLRGDHSEGRVMVWHPHFEWQKMGEEKKKGFLGCVIEKKGGQFYLIDIEWDFPLPLRSIMETPLPLIISRDEKGFVSVSIDTKGKPPHLSSALKMINVLLNLRIKREAAYLERLI